MTQFSSKPFEQSTNMPSKEGAYTFRDKIQLANYIGGAVDMGIVNIKKVFINIPEQAAKVATREVAYVGNPEKTLTQLQDNDPTMINDATAWQLSQDARQKMIDAYSEQQTREHVDA